jgi:hypothetical protein
MSRRNTERKMNRPESAAEPSAAAVMLLVWRKCPVCGWETESIESQDANPLCPRCQSPTERQAVAPLDSHRKTEKGTPPPKPKMKSADARKRSKPRG